MNFQNLIVYSDFKCRRCSNQAFEEKTGTSVVRDLVEQYYSQNLYISKKFKLLNTFFKKFCPMECICI